MSLRPTTRVHDTVDVALVEAWHHLNERRREATQMSQPEWYTSVISSLPGARPIVLTRWDGDELTTLVAARIERIPVPARIGYRQLLPGRVETLQVMRGCVLGPVPDAKALLDDLLAVAAAQGAHCVAFPRLPIHHPIVTAIIRRPRPWRRTTAPTQPHHRSSIGDGGYDELMAGSNSTRKRVRKYQRRLARDHDVVLDVYTGAESVDAFLAEAMPIARGTYQYALGAGLGAVGEAERLRAVAALGWFRGYILRVDGEAWTYDYGFLHRGIYTASGTGYRTEHAAARPGNIALAMWIDDLGANGVTEIDWGEGDAEYKRSVSTAVTPEKPMAVYRRTLVGTLYAVAGTAVDAVDRIGRRLATRLGRTEEFKSNARGRLRMGADQAARIPR